MTGQHSSGRSEFDPFQQKGFAPAIAVQFGPSTITICPHRPAQTFAVVSLFLAGALAIPLLVFLLLGDMRWFGWALLSACVVLAILLGAFYAEVFRGPYLIIDPVAKKLTFPRLKCEVAYVEIRRLISGREEENNTGTHTGYWFLDAEFLDYNHDLRRATLIATIERRRFQRLEGDVRAALGLQENK